MIMINQIQTDKTQYLKFYLRFAAHSSSFSHSSRSEEGSGAQVQSEEWCTPSLRSRSAPFPCPYLGAGRERIRTLPAPPIRERE
jgi:hypothetical protein